MNRVLIIVPRYVPYKVKAYYEFPLGLAYISASLKRAGHEVDVLNLNHYEGSPRELIQKKFSEQNYRYAMSGGLSAHYKQLKGIVENVRGVSKNAIVVLGGGVMSSTPELMYIHLNPDYMVLGEGEITIVELLSEIESGGKNLKSVKGIGFRNTDGELVITRSRESIDDLDSLPWPDLEAFEFETYLKCQGPNDNLYQYIHDEPRFYPIISSRGCPYNCTFCYHPLGRKYRSRSVEDFLKEAETVVDKYGVNNLAIFDELLSAKRDRLLALCKGLKKLSHKVRWMCQLRVDSIDQGLLHIMRDSGCFMISYGFESASDTVLSSMKKYITVKQIEEALKMTRKARVGIQGYFIFGDTAETYETAKETLDFWYRYQDYHITMGYIRPYPGSELWKREVQNGHLSNFEKQLDFLDSCIAAPPNLSRMNDSEWFDLQYSVQRATILNDNFSESISSFQEDEDGMYTFTIKCVHCKEEVVYRHFKQRILGIFKITCRKCNQESNVSPLIFHHVSEDYKRNLQAFWMIRSNKVAVTVTPCMNEAEFLAMYDIALPGVTIENFLDKDPKKTERPYRGLPVYQRNSETIQRMKDNYFVIPLTRFASRIFKDLVGLGVDPDKVCRLDEVLVGPCKPVLSKELV